MLRYLIPQVALRDLPPMFGVGIVDAIIAGTYGILHDQVTFSISPEYFTKLKFEQFRWANLGLPERVFVAEIGFLATWWVGLFCGWFLARRHIPGQSPISAWRKIMIGCGIILLCALPSAGAGFGYGSWRGPNADYSPWRTMLDFLHIEDHWSFIPVAYIHNASYLGGLIGLILALACVHPKRQPTNPTPAATSPA
ncbi:MAG: hypothetical protein IAF94_11250 [Pirellulaceae bacterium]|nr:hypothetical protein [Pirellulaceae bacterium]